MVSQLLSTSKSTPKVEELVATKNVDKHIEQLLEVKRRSKELRVERDAARKYTAESEL